MGALARPVTPDKVISFTIALTRGVWCSALLADYSRDSLTKVTRRDRSVTDDQFDDLRTIPGTDTKNGEPRRVPLTKSAINIIKAQQKSDSVSEFVFVGTTTSMLDRAKKTPALIRRTLGIDFRGHDLRRTAATRMAAAGVPREHIARVLNHVEGGARATRVYDRHTYDVEKRAALESWARSLAKIVAAKRSERRPRRA
jgi:integrase